MKLTKRLTALLLAVLMAFSLFACTSTPSAPTVTPSAAPTALPSAAPTPQPTPTPEPEIDEAAALVEKAYQLAPGEALPGTFTLTGRIACIDTPWSDRYENLTVTMQVGDLISQPILCFRLEGPGASGLRVGDEITVTGRLINYKGTIEFDEGCRLEAVNGSVPVATPEPTPAPRPTPSQSQGAAPVDRDGYYYDPESVVLYLHYYGQLPPNFITKGEARKLGWSSGSVERYFPDGAIGGDTFTNRERILPSASGRTYTECDMYTNGGRSRGACRLVFSNDGLYFYTEDHYRTFTQLVVTEEGTIQWK